MTRDPSSALTRRRRLRSSVFAAAMLAVVAACSSAGPTEAPRSTGTVTIAETGGSSAPDTPDVRALGSVTEGLRSPWGLAFLPDGDAVVTSRDDATVTRVGADGSKAGLGTIDGVVPGGEGGLLGIAVSPDFATDGLLFVYFTAADDNRIAAVRLEGDRLGDQDVILSGIPKAGTHNGGRMIVGPDGYLYVGTGDAQNRSGAQDLGYLGGKILRITTGGDPAPGNPFADNPLVYSYGHRNVQGLAFAPDGTLWAAEFGQNTWDELNVIQAGGNYGWPEVEGFGEQPRYVEPVQVWSTEEASPSGIAVADGAVWVAGLRGQRLWRVPIDGDTGGAPSALLTGEYGRLRAVEPAPDGSLWVVTSNTDGRGDVRDGDDRILRLG